MFSFKKIVDSSANVAWKENFSTYLGWGLNKFFYNLLPLIASLLFNDASEQIFFGFLAFNMTLLVTTYTNPSVDFVHLGDWDFSKHLIFFYCILLGLAYGGYHLLLDKSFLNNEITWRMWLFDEGNILKVYLWTGGVLLLFTLLCDWQILRDQTQNKIIKNQKIRGDQVENRVQSWKEKLK